MIEYVDVPRMSERVMSQSSPISPERVDRLLATVAELDLSEPTAAMAHLEAVFPLRGSMKRSADTPSRDRWLTLSELALLCSFPRVFFSNSNYR